MFFLASRVNFPKGFPAWEVGCDWFTLIAARFSRRSLGRRDYVTSQKNVCVGGYIVVFFVLLFFDQQCETLQMVHDDPEVLLKVPVFHSS